LIFYVPSVNRTNIILKLVVRCKTSVADN
jgi:hypothetical protein